MIDKDERDLDADGPEQGQKKNKPYAKVLGGMKYDSEEGIRPRDFLTPTHDYVRRYNVRESFKKTKANEKDWPYADAVIKPDLKAVFQVWNESNKAFEIKDVKGYAELKSFFESDEGKAKRLMESGGFDIDGGGMGRGTQMNAERLLDTEFVPIMAGPFFKQMYIYDYLFMHSKAFELVNHSALAAAAIKIMQRFTIGRGLSFHIKDDDVRDCWDEFWIRNQMAKRSRGIARDINWQGEIMLKYLEIEDGRLSVRSLDPSTCWEIVTDPEDIEKVYYYHFQWPSQYQIWTSGQIPVSQYFIQQIPPTNIQHHKINVSSMEKRGRSELLPGMRWLKRFENLYDGRTLKAVLEANLVWVITVKGDQGDVDALTASQNVQEMPPPGGTWIQNEAVSLEPASASLTAGGRGMDVGQEIANVFMASLNLPGEYINVSGDHGGSARATALVKTDPAVKTIEEKQQMVKEIVMEMYERVLTSAVMAKKLDPKKAAQAANPDIVPEDDPDQVKRAAKRGVVRAKVSLR
jgi:hypothetical protein